MSFSQSHQIPTSYYLQKVGYQIAANLTERLQCHVLCANWIWWKFEVSLWSFQNTGEKHVKLELSGYHNRELKITYIISESDLPLCCGLPEDKQGQIDRSVIKRAIEIIDSKAQAYFTEKIKAWEL